MLWGPLALPTSGGNGGAQETLAAENIDNVLSNQPDVVVPTGKILRRLQLTKHPAFAGANICSIRLKKYATILLTSPLQMWTHEEKSARTYLDGTLL